MSRHILRTGNDDCYDDEGARIPCRGSGQDGDMRPGRPWPEPRFGEAGEGLVLDRLTGLIWPQDANLFSFPMSWQEGLESVARLNEEGAFARSDWRLPNRRELRSLICHGSRKPALPAAHPFRNVFLGWHWTSTTAARARKYAWYVHLEGGRMFYGRKDSLYLVWPVCGSSTILPATGQHRCFDAMGEQMGCRGTGQDGELRRGVAWPSPRFAREHLGIRDRLTGLLWHPQADLLGAPSNWSEALAAVTELAERTALPWRLPTINELESLVDASHHSPALPAGHPFSAVQEAYWSATTSFFEPDWSYVLYLHKGAVGVGYKKNRDFSIWPVIDDEGQQAFRPKMST